MILKRYALYIVLFFAAVSCVSKKKLVYLQGTPGGSSSATYEPIIQPDDMLFIHLTSENTEAVAPFNAIDARQLNNNTNYLSYLVNKDGKIDFPVLGELKAAGLTRSEFTEMLKTRLRSYVTDPVVNMRFLNFRVTVLGEVSRPGRVESEGDRLTLLDAIAQSGDLTLYGMRQNILIVRDNNGEKTFNRVDVTAADFVNSPFYYLKQNDVIYVEPRRAKVDSTAIGGNVTTIISIISFLITTTLLLTRL